MRSWKTHEFGIQPTARFYFGNKNEHYKHKSAAPDYSGNDVTVRTDEKTAQPQRHDETRNIDERKGHSYSFKESTKLYPNLTEMKREGRKTKDSQLKQKETITKNFN